jgi:hypothetical protein
MKWEYGIYEGDAKNGRSLRERIEVRAVERFVPPRLPARRDVSR